MNVVNFFSASFFLLMLTLMSQTAAAAGSACTFSKSLQQKGTAFDITSRPAGGCAVQIVTVSVRRGGKKIAEMKADVDYLARSARAVDLTGDGTPELAVISLPAGGNTGEQLDVYLLEGTKLRRLTVPELDDKSGYRGGDSFQVTGRTIVRSIPTYRDNDPAGKPTGEPRSLQYELRDGALSLAVPTEKAPGVPAAQSEPEPVKEVTAAAQPMPPVVAPTAITGIVADETGLEIKANGIIAGYKTVLLSRPERIAIDIPGTTSALTGKKIAINRFGISTARVERRKGALRIVFDTTNRTFDSYKVRPSGHSIYITFIQ